MADGTRGLVDGMPAITSISGVQAGHPCVGRTRIRVIDVVGLISAGETVDAVADDYGLDVPAVRWACAWWTLFRWNDDRPAKWERLTRSTWRDWAHDYRTNHGVARFMTDPPKVPR